MTVSKSLRGPTHLNTYVPQGGRMTSWHIVTVTLITLYLASKNPMCFTSCQQAEQALEVWGTEQSIMTCY